MGNDNFRTVELSFLERLCSSREVPYIEVLLIMLQQDLKGTHNNYRLQVDLILLLYYYLVHKLSGYSSSILLCSHSCHMIRLLHMVVQDASGYLSNHTLLWLTTLNLASINFCPLSCICTSRALWLAGHNAQLASYRSSASWRSLVATIIHHKLDCHIKSKSWQLQGQRVRCHGNMGTPQAGPSERARVVVQSSWLNNFLLNSPKSFQKETLRNGEGVQLVRTW